MSELGEAVGGAIEGGLYARAVESKDGASPGSQAREGACLNCGASLAGSFCQHCGQKAQVHRTISAIMHDVLHGALHLDGKLWHTLPLLALKPGELTRRYIEGERARFVSPMALFLFSVFLMFAVFQAVGLTTPAGINGAGNVSGTVAEARRSMEAERDEVRERLAAMAADDPARAEAEASLAEAEGALEGMAQVDRYALNENAGITLNLTGIEAIDEGIVRKWRENPSLMLYKLQANAYKFSWLLIPISIPFVWLLFAWRRRFRAYDHAVFVTYSLSFMTLLFVTLSLLGKAGIGTGWLVTALTLVPPVHIYKQLRGTYGLSRFSAFWRLIVLSAFIWIIIVLFLQALFLLGAF
jgi:hypothetical protein